MTLFCNLFMERPSYNPLHEKRLIYRKLEAIGQNKPSPTVVLPCGK